MQVVLLFRSNELSSKTLFGLQLSRKGNVNYLVGALIFDPSRRQFFLLSIGKFDQSLTTPIRNLITKSYIRATKRDNICE